MKARCGRCIGQLTILLDCCPLALGLIRVPNDFACAGHLRRGLKGAAVDNFLGLTFPREFALKRQLIATHDASHLFLGLATSDCEFLASLVEDKGYAF